jgi:HD superfamily phosphodiesterase
MNKKKMYELVETHVNWLFANIQHPHLIFHNLSHTQNVVKHSGEIAKHYNLTENEKLLLLTAAWFHDVGHLVTKPENHESMSCEIMKKFLIGHAAKESEINIVADCIMVTKAPRHPKNLMEQIICDADTYHLGTREFAETNERVFKEERMRHSELTLTKFNEDTLKMLQSHQFYTNLCKQLLGKGKIINMCSIENQLK